MSLELVSFRKSTSERVSARSSVGRSNHKSSRVFPSRSIQEREIDMRANGLNGTSSDGKKENNTSISDKKLQNGDWLAAQLAQRSVDEVVSKTGMTAKAVQNVRQRRAKLSFDNFTELCQNDPDFAAAYAEYVGLIRPGEAEFAGALTQAFNAYQRRQP